MVLYDFKFDPIKSYLDNTQEMILRQNKELAEKYQKWDKEHGHNIQMPDADDMYYTEILNSCEFPNILNQSIYLTIYSIFENEFFELCEYCKNEENLKISPKDIKGQNYIDQCRKYITKVLNVNLDNLNGNWIQIIKYQVIRNSIAHNNGVIKSATPDILVFIERSEGISIDNTKSKIKIESIDFLKKLIDNLTDFLSKIIHEITKQKAKASS